LQLSRQRVESARKQAKNYISNNIILLL